jgi:acyl homoserine lactone synthase
MFRLRHKVFKERLDWNVSVAGEMEFDTYDGLGPTYLLALIGRSVVGSVRLLPTTGPNMLANTFSLLLGGNSAPRSPDTSESSRFCVDTEYAAELGARGINKMTYMLFAGMVEWGLRTSISQIVTVTDVRMERVLRRAGWPLYRISEPHIIGDTTAVAGTLKVSENAASLLRAAGNLDTEVLPSGLLIAA